MKPTTLLILALACACGLHGQQAVSAPLTGTVAQWGDYVLPLVAPGTRFKAIASGADYTFLAVKADGTLVGWGQNYYGEAAPPPGLSNVVAICEAEHSLALKSDSRVAAWGDNSMGQLAVPATLSNVVAVSAASSHSVALKADGTVVAWSDNFANESTVPPALSNVRGVTAGPYLSLALLSDGAVFDMGQNTNVVGASNAVLIAASGVSSFDPLAIRSDGTVFDIKRPTNNLPYPSNTVAIAFSDAGDLGLLSDGTVVTLINGVAASVLCCARAIAVGGYGILALKLDGSIVELGLNWAADVPLWGKVREITAIAAEGEGTMALRPDGTILCWDSTDQAAVAGLSNVTAVAHGYYHGVAVKADRTVFAWGDDSDGQTDVPAGLTNVTAIAAGGYHSLALIASGTVVGWGYDPYGQAHGFDTYCDHGATAISAGELHNIALLSNGRVYAWGYNHQGQCNIPGEISAVFCPATPGPVVAVAAGGAHNLALKNDGTVVAWGYNNHGQTKVPAGLSNVVAIAAGGDHSLALKSDGTIVAWGSNDHGESTIPSSLGPAIAISAGFADSMALVLPEVPELNAFLSDSAFAVAWPTNYGGFTLQCTTNLRSENWVDWTNPPAVVGHRFFATNPPAGPAAYFRLKK